MCLWCNGIILVVYPIASKFEPISFKNVSLTLCKDYQSVLQTSGTSLRKGCCIAAFEKAESPKGSSADTAEQRGLT